MKITLLASLFCLFLIAVPVFRPNSSLVAGQAQTATTPDPPNVIAPGAKVEKVAGDFGFIEGPVWRKEGYLLFTDIPRNRIMKWHPKDGVAVFREPSEQANGLALDAKGRLLACEHKARRVSRTEADGKVTTLVDKFEGKRLNSPNDLTFGRDGSIYFTDPPYGLPQQKEGKEVDFNGVYRLTPKGELTALAKDFDRPNGIAFAPDRKTLYVADTAKRHVRAFDVKADGSLANGRVFAEVPGPDGIKVDVKGNLYATGQGGVWVFDKQGKKLGVIATPETPANCGFGDADFKTLYMTARTGLYRIRLQVAGTKP